MNSVFYRFKEVRKIRLINVDDLIKVLNGTYETSFDKEEILKHIESVEEYSLDLRLKDLLHHIELNNTVRLNWKDTGESFVPTIGNLVSYYADMYITRIYVNNGQLNIDMAQNI